MAQIRMRAVPAVREFMGKNYTPAAERPEQFRDINSGYMFTSGSQRYDMAQEKVRERKIREEKLRDQRRAESLKAEARLRMLREVVDTVNDGTENAERTLQAIVQGERENIRESKQTIHEDLDRRTTYFAKAVESKLNRNYAHKKAMQKQVKSKGLWGRIKGLFA